MDLSLEIRHARTSALRLGGATVVSVTAMGPFAMTYVNPADDPRETAHP